MKNPVLENIYTRRSIRKYKSKKLTKQTIQELLDAAVMAPSARDKQPCYYTIIQNKKIMKRLSDIALSKPRLINLGVKLLLKSRNTDSIFYNAPLLIVISGKKGYNYLEADANLSAQTLFLAAHSLGIGSCYIGLANTLQEDDEARKIIKIPKNHEIVSFLIFGYPDERIPVPNREPKILNWL
jgi:nitroreductase